MMLTRAFVLSALAACSASAQTHDHQAMGPASSANLHMEMTPLRAASAGDSARAAAVAHELRAELAKYRDTSAAVADGYKMFLPNVKVQKVYHFTNNWRAVQEAFRFDPRKPSSLLYKKDASGRMQLVGAMYTAPKRWDADRLDERVPLSVARWHKHVNWCMPKKGETERWLERKDGQPVFGPESPIATKSACDAVHGNFVDSLFGWMLHANVLEGDDPASIWGDEHAGHDMSAGMRTGVDP
ncbi:MAG: hypothetical protein ABIY52_02465 [Gemmatimonadaceae bacterium]